MSFDFESAVAAPFRMQPGLRRLAAGTPQTTPNRSGDRHLREKLAVLLNWPEQALLSVPGFDAGPALAALIDQAVAEHPQALSTDTAGERLSAHWLGWSVDRSGDIRSLSPTGATLLPEVGTCLGRLMPEWRRSALLALALQEDLAIVDGRTAGLPWLAVALPSHWAPADKIGRHFAEVHAPVADNRLLITAADHLMHLVTRSERWERSVWNVTASPRLHQHPARVDPEPWPADLAPQAVPGLAWFRSERQTFIPLPERGQAVFTIQVRVEPLAQAVAAPGRAGALQAALASMSPAVLAYRQLDRLLPALLDWLGRQAAAERAGDAGRPGSA